jgi:MATE family multidrug resistance protein
MNKKILQLAIPSIISNITVPLLGLIDVAIAGHLGSAAYIGAIAVGSMLFNIFYWNFSFLRMGTSGLTAQAFGSRNFSEAAGILIRGLAIAIIGGLLIILLQIPVLKLAFIILETSPDVQRFASIYFSICVWGAPAVLASYTLQGWFIGMQNTRYPMIVSICMNIVNIFFSLLFVVVFGMKIEGVASGTLIAQYFGLFLCLVLLFSHYRRLKKVINIEESFQWKAMKRFISVNGGIFIRTLCLISVTSFFTYAGARQGDAILAVNTLLMQLFILYSYFMDGFAYAGEALSGRYTGARNKLLLQCTIRYLFYWGSGICLVFTFLYGIGAESFLSVLTNEKSVIETAQTYFYWVLVIPLAGFAAFLWDGIFIGATAIRPMVYAMIAATIVFFVLYFALYDLYGNHALWIAFLCYLSIRGIVQSIWAKRNIYSGNV